MVGTGDFHGFSPLRALAGTILPSLLLEKG